MRLPIFLSLAALAAGLAHPAAAETSSEYSRLDVADDCTVYARADDGEGDWADMVCNGFRGYPVFLSYGDARESVFFGFPPAGGERPDRESFQAFNSAGPTIEWRLRTDGDNQTPFAAIQRWFVSASVDSDEKTEVLVIEKVGQPLDRDGCAVGYVVATHNTNANQKAREIADRRVPDFVCGADQPIIDAGDVPLPPFSGQAD